MHDPNDEKGGDAMKVCFLPMDSRPCTCDFPAQLAAVFGNCEVVQPPASMMDFFKTPSNADAIWAWVTENSADADYLVFSVEQLLFGSLLASRTPERSEAEAVRRLEGLLALKHQNPRLKLYAFNVIMRTTVSALSDDSVHWLAKITRYSKLRYLLETAPPEEKPAIQKELDALVAEIPPEILNTFLAVRERNHAVNRRCVELCADGVFEKLVLLQEDSWPESLQVLEQQKLHQLIDAKGVRDRVWLHNGTDEAGMEMLVLAVSGGVRRPVAIKWLSDNTDFTARYEDRPFKDNLYSHLRLMQLTEDASAEDCLVILPPKSRQLDCCPAYDPETHYAPEVYREMCEVLYDLERQGKRCYLLDINYANGGDWAFFEALDNAFSLYGYAGWNTACNSLGTILAQLVASRGCHSDANTCFTFERFLDDVFYQAVVRRKLSVKLKAIGEDTLSIKDTVRAQALMDETVCENVEALEALFGHCQPSFAMTLRWPRIFEAKAAIRHL